MKPYQMKNIIKMRDLEHEQLREGDDVVYTKAAIEAEAKEKNVCFS